MSDEVLHQTLSADLAAAGIDVEQLAVIYVGNDQYLAEVLNTSSEDGRFEVFLKNPRRLVRLQGVREKVFSFELLLIDLDFIDSGEITVWPDVFYKLSDLDQTSRVRYMSLYSRYLKDKMLAKAAAAGIVAPGAEGIGSNVRPLR